ncbi:DUF3313 family protein [Pseudomonas putida]|nr:DUF3313 family protein [Pseudomonas putida]
MYRATNSQYVEPDQYSGLLKDYSKHKEEKSPSGAAVMRWIKLGIDVRQFNSVATEAAFIDGRSNEVVAEVVRKGAGADLENSSQVMQAKDARTVLHGWARDMVNAFQALKKSSNVLLPY